MPAKLLPKTLLFGSPFLHRREHTHKTGQDPTISGQELLLAENPRILYSLLQAGSASTSTLLGHAFLLAKGVWAETAGA